ncbi:amino acid permease-domain-containing protein [Xylariomycetidae sp. FL2044]|nr:amino acid permease-domain-containing protein [Xylariomycetidae sp. FL2044]
MSSRSLYSMACEGNAPRIFARTNRWGVPVNAVLGSAVFALLSYLNVGSGTSAVFNWFISLTNTAGIISWIICCIIFLRFMKAVKVQGVTKLPYSSVLQPYGAWICLFFFCIILLLNGFSVFLPGQWDVTSFLTAYIGIPAFLVIFAGHRITHWKEPWYIPAERIDITTGLAEVEAMEAEDNEARRYAKEQESSEKSWAKKFMKILG